MNNCCKKLKFIDNKCIIIGNYVEFKKVIGIYFFFNFT